MISILFLIEAFYWNIFRCNYVRNEKLFLIYFLGFGNIDSILNILRVKITLMTDVFLNLRTPKNMVR